MRAQRLLSILMHLQVNRRVTARELAKKLEVSERTILRDMDALGGSGISIFASLYPALYRLENKGWLKTEWKTTEGGREGKYYSLTKAGQQQLAAETAGWKRLCEAISLVLEIAE
jgi:DNA-binding PadR family transcriptional regulator